MEKMGNNTFNSEPPVLDQASSVGKNETDVSHSSGTVPGGSPAARGRNRARVSGNIIHLQQANKRRVEGALSKYTNMLQGWQSRYFVLDSERGHLQYFVNEQCKGQKPRGSLPLLGASVDPSDEVPHMFIVHSASGELYKLRAADAREQQFWMSHLLASTRRHSDSSAKELSGRARSLSLLPVGPPLPSVQRHPPHPTATGNIVSMTHHKSPAAARPVYSRYPDSLLEVKEVIIQAEGQQKSLIHSIESLPARGPVSCLDQDLLLLKATSTATLGCLGECLSILQRNAGQAPPTQGSDPPSDGVSLWLGSESPKGGRSKDSESALSTPAETALGPAYRRRSSAQGGKKAEQEAVGPDDGVPDTRRAAYADEEEEEEEEEELEEQQSLILHLLSQLKQGTDVRHVRARSTRKVLSVACGQVNKVRSLHQFSGGTLDLD